jgi:hypothetical protein
MPEGAQLADPKLTHRQVHYRQALSASKRCGVCSMYVYGRPPACSLVTSPIRPFMLCDRFDPREEKKHAKG